jgi:hypothetical protein
MIFSVSFQPFCQSSQVTGFIQASEPPPDFPGQA